MVTSDQNLCHWVFCVFPPLLPRTFLQNRRRQSKCAAKRKLLEWKCNENIWKSGEMLAAHQDNQDFAAAPCCLCILFFRLKYLPLYGPLWQFGQPLPAKAVFLLIDIKSRQRWSKQILNLNYKLHGTFYQFYTDEKLTIPSVKEYLLYPFIAPKIILFKL